MFNYVLFYVMFKELIDDAKGKRRNSGGDNSWKIEWICDEVKSIIPVKEAVYSKSKNEVMCNCATEPQ